MTALKLQNIRKAYGSIEVLHGIDLDVEPGEFVVLVGPSGCGKSTLLRMIAGLENISDGDLWIGGQLVNTLPAQKRNISMVFQSYALFPHMTVRGNIEFGPRIRREPGAQIEKRLMDAVTALNLGDYLDRYPRQLSGGQRQRVAMGRTIVRDSSLFLFDEPLSNLDAKLRVQMRAEIKALHQSLRSTIIYVTHDQVEAMTMADRIVVMNSGRIEQSGAPLELYDHPANRFVAGFLGSPAMSMLPASIYQENDKCWAQVSSGEKIALSGVCAEQGRKVDIGIRPEQFTIAQGEAGLPFIVGVVEPTGAETHLVGTIAQSKVHCVFRERVQAMPGSTIRLNVDPQHVHVFDTETGHRIRLRQATEVA